MRGVGQKKISLSSKIFFSFFNDLGPLLDPRNLPTNKSMLFSKVLCLCAFIVKRDFHSAPYGPVMNVNIHLHLSDRERQFLEEKLGPNYMTILIKECVDISKMRVCTICNKWFSRTSIKRHNATKHNKPTFTHGH